ncbi:PDDEXK nuclease domain-containing protein [Daejeonella sp.]|uniref:PDDEXK nuclease domain-containing protein n=1 Tax=Daejeonella sp. TaxID=2805397 RepID=UPI0035261F43
MIGNSKLSPAVRESNKDLTNTFKDSYVFEFLNLPEPHNESDLQRGLVRQMKNFILELGKDSLFIGEEYKLQVGNSDFFIDLLFYHRGLQCLVVGEAYNGIIVGDPFLLRKVSTPTRINPVVFQGFIENRFLLNLASLVNRFHCSQKPRFNSI